MNIEKLNYPWKDDTNALQREIEQLKATIQDIKYQNDNLKYFCQQLYDRLNMANNYSQPTLNKPY